MDAEGCGGCRLWRLRVWRLQFVEAEGVETAVYGCCSLWMLKVVEAAGCGGCSLWMLQAVEAEGCGG